MPSFLRFSHLRHRPSNQRLEAIVKRGTLRLGMTGDYAPFSAFDPSTSTFRGFDVDIGPAPGVVQPIFAEYSSSVTGSIQVM